MVEKRRTFGTMACGLAAILIVALLVSGCIGNTSKTTTPATTAVTTVSPAATTAIATQATTVPTVAPANTTTTTNGSASSALTGASTGRLTITGSTTVLPIAQAWAEAFMAANKGADVQVSGGGSGVGVQAIGEKTAMIGMSSREVTADELKKYPSMTITPIARDGLSVIVNPQNMVTTLTLSQIRGIYNGTITNWKDVGGADLSIVVIGRDSSSGTRDFISSAVMQKDNFTSSVLEKNSNGAVETGVSTTPGAIGYVGLGYTKDAVKALTLSANGAAVAPSVATVVDGTYPLSRKLYMLTNGPATGIAKDFLDYALSQEGQKVVEDQGFVRI
ncbi:phosphate ABC transporter substrate-binding protein [Methanosphaerula palustris]|uniref:Phosphate binding protein n=1 Tax=Methanosphaerula palustris (strain ATCC BAA-1556 / DSM 19958 / E1-9c) TaxID=521011 RepID=B8GKH1_METPE|nr:phosphate ABC transporter substrate-binding protein [Methanosphaerula palustris]ACL15854.1 phosphate binding protein [Methanosphaerula palustris E1-9c]